MSSKTKKGIGIIVAAATAALFACFFFSLALLPVDPVEAQEEDSVEAWKCPVDSQLHKNSCDLIMANDPYYLSEEDAMENAPPREEGMIPSWPPWPSCQLDTGNKRVACQGSKVADTFYIGKHQNQFTICIVGIGYYHYNRNDFKYVYATLAGGNDMIEVVQTGSTRTCTYGSSSITVNPFDPSWDEYLEAYGYTGTDTIIGTPNGDFLHGEDEADYLWGMGGLDNLYGGRGSDTLCAGDGGFDHLYGGDGEDTLLGAWFGVGSGYDWMYGEGERDIYVAGPDGAYMQDELEDHDFGNEFYGSPVGDTMFGDDGPDYMEGRGGSDSLNGYGGKDEIWGGDPSNSMDDLADTIFGDNDSIAYDTDVIHGGHGDDFIVGGGGGDWIWGEGESDTIYGDDEGGIISGNDCIIGDYGREGLDTYVGDEGADTIVAGGGNDCVYCDSVDMPEGICDPAHGYEPPEGRSDSATNCLSDPCHDAAYSCDDNLIARCENAS